MNFSIKEYCNNNTDIRNTVYREEIKNMRDVVNEKSVFFPLLRANGLSATVEMIDGNPRYSVIRNIKKKSAMSMIRKRLSSKYSNVRLKDKY